MKKRRKKRKSCRGKAKHKTMVGAYIALKKTNKNNFIFHKMRPYKCPFCGYWHIGKTRHISYKKFDELHTKYK